MGNVGSVAVAIVTGGPGAIFWMWVTALVGISTQFFTSSLAVIYGGRDSSGEIQGGAMYYIVMGLGRRWKFMAVFFSVFGMIGVTSMFQAILLAPRVMKEARKYFKGLEMTKK